jgi:CRISPR system Cascade subunit CasA
MAAAAGDAVSFDLVDEPWIPVLTGGGTRLVSLRECLVNAHAVDSLATTSPLETVAVFRQVLLPAYLDAVFGEPRAPLPADGEAWEQRWKTGQLDRERLDSYLTRFADRFQLFGSRPFAQAAGLRTASDQPKPVSVLIAAAASGNVVPLFSARTEADPPALAPGQAARALLGAHCWDTAGIKTGAAGDPQVKAGKTTGNRTGPLGSLGVVMPLGRNLAETLLLHIPVQNQPLRPGDRPQWRASPDDQDYPGRPGWSTRPARGLLDLLTWQARRIRLIPEVTGSGQVVVRQAVMTAGDRLTDIPHYEPHTAWKHSDKAGHQVPVRHVAGRAAWRGLQPLLAVTDDPASPVTSPERLRQISSLLAGEYLPEDLPLQALTVGVQYGTQSAVVEDVIADQIPLPVTALDPSGPVRALLDRIVGQADGLRAAANRLGDDLRQASGGDKLAWNQGQRLGDMLVHEFTPLVRTILARLQADPGQADAAEDAWRRAARRLAIEAAEPALTAVPPGAFLGRTLKDDHPRRCSTAEASYRAAISKILGVSAPAATTNGGQPE